MKKTLSIIIILTTLGILSFYFISKYKSPKASQNQTSEYYNLTNSTDVSNWKKYEIAIPENPAVTEYKLPKDWRVEESIHSGHPNYAVLRGPDDMCILFSRLYMPADSKIEDQLKMGEINVLVDKYYDGTDTTVPNIQERQKIMANGNEGLIETIVKSKNEFQVVALNLGKSAKYADMTEYAVLSTCTNKEAGIFTNVVNSIKLK